jgi:hypothetical protein
VELSLTLERENISLKELVAVWVDPISIRGGQLVDTVRSAVASSGWPRPVKERYISSERREVLGDIVRYLTDRTGPPRLRLLLGRADVSEWTREWAAALLGRDLEWLFDRYAEYLLDGTLDVPSEGPAIDPQEGHLSPPLARDPADLQFLPS